MLRTPVLMAEPLTANATNESFKPSSQTITFAISTFASDHTNLLSSSLQTSQYAPPNNWSIP